MIDFNKTHIPLFRRFVLQNFPFIEQDFDALTDYQLLCKVIEYLNKVITTTNEISEQVEVLTNAYNTLKDYVDHYFDNLDVQEEINNKLDEMAEDGTLQEIIGDYLNATAVWGFYTVADMAASTNLIAGSYARTLGHTTINDHKGGLYKIVDAVDANYTQEDLGNGLYANLILDIPDYLVDKEVVVLTGTISEQTYTNKYVYMDNCTVYKSNFVNCVVTGSYTTGGNWSVILDDNSTAYRLNVTCHDTSDTAIIYGLVLRGTNVKAINCNFTNRFYESIFACGRNMIIENCKFANAKGTGLYYVINIKVGKVRNSINDGTYAVAYPENLEIRNCNFDNIANDHVEFFTGGRNFKITNCSFNNDEVFYISSKSFSYERPEGYNTVDDYAQNILIENCSFIRSTHTAGINIIKYIDENNNYGVSDWTFNRCYFKNCQVELSGVENFNFTNNEVINADNKFWIHYTVGDGVMNVTTVRNRLTLTNNNIKGLALNHYGLYALYLDNNLFTEGLTHYIQGAAKDGVYKKGRIYSNNNIFIAKDITNSSSNAMSYVYGTVISNNDIMYTRSYINCIDTANIYVNNLIVNGGTRIVYAGGNLTNGTVNYHRETGVSITNITNPHADSTLTFTSDVLI